MQLHILVREQDERGRRRIGLGDVEDSDLLTMRYRGTFEIHGFEEAVNLSRADALAALRRDQFQTLEQLVQFLADIGGGEDRVRVVEELQAAAHLLLEEIAVGRGTSVFAV